MKRHLIVFAALAALALPAVVRAEEQTGRSAVARAASTERSSVDAADLMRLLEQKGVITRADEKALTHLNGAPSIDDKTMQEYFDAPPYHREGWQGGPSSVSD